MRKEAVERMFEGLIAAWSFLNQICSESSFLIRDALICVYGAKRESSRLKNLSILGGFFCISCS